MNQLINLKPPCFDDVSADRSDDGPIRNRRANDCITKPQERVGTKYFGKGKKPLGEPCSTGSGTPEVGQ